MSKESLEKQLKREQEEQKEDKEKMDRLQKTADKLVIRKIKSDLDKVKKDEQYIQEQMGFYLQGGLLEEDAKNLSELDGIIKASNDRIGLIKTFPDSYNEKKERLEKAQKTHDGNFKKFNLLLNEARKRAGEKKEPENPTKTSEHQTNEIKSNMNPLRKKETTTEEVEEEEFKTLTPEEMIEKQITELGVEKILPEVFNELKAEQKLLVLENLKQRIVDLVKSDAQTQYSEYLKQKIVSGGENRTAKILNTIKNISISLKEGVSKEAVLKNLENKVFQELLTSEENKKIIADDFKMLTENTKDKEVELDSNNKPMIIYLDSNELKDCTREEREAIEKYNVSANEFRKLPYEWGQEGKTILAGHKRKYEKAKEEYENMAMEVLEIKEKRENPENKGKAMTEMLQAENALHFDQLLNTHPEFEKEFQNLSENSRLKDYLESGGKSFWKKFKGTGGVNALLTGAGFSLRMGTKLVAGLTATSTAVASSATFVAAPIIGGSIGALRARFRGKETLAQRQKEARYGKKDESKERIQTTDAIHLTKKLENLVRRVETAPLEQSEDEKNKRENLKDRRARVETKEEALSNLIIRIEHTQGKIEKGQVNFGDKKSALINQFNLINSLNKAIILKESLVKITNEDIENRINDLLSYSAEKIRKRTSEAQTKFIHKQMTKGALMGAGFATAGYTVRYLGEHLGWWGGHHGEQAMNNITETNPEDLKKIDPEVIKIIKSIENLDSEDKNNLTDIRLEKLLEKVSKVPSDLEIKKALGLIPSDTLANVESGSLQKLITLDADTLKAISSLDSTQIQNIIKISPDTLAKLDSVSIAKLANLSPDSLTKVSSLDSATVSNLSKLSGQELQKAIDLAKAAELKSQIIEQMRPIPKVDFNSRGAIQTILDLKEQIHHNYPDLSKAPHSVQEFMNTDATKEAIKLGFYNPEDPNSAESAMVWKGSTLSFDKNGNLVFHDIKTNESHILIQEKNNTETIEKYSGKMFDSDNNNPNESGTGTNIKPEDLKLKEEDLPYNPQHSANIESIKPIISLEQDIEHNVSNPATNPDGSGRTDYDISGKSELQKVNFEHTPLTQEQQIEKAYNENMLKIFPSVVDENTWGDKLMNNSTDFTAKVLLDRNYTLGGDYAPVDNMSLLIKSIHEVTGLEPEGVTVAHPVAETPDEYIRRGLEYAGKHNMLDQIKIDEGLINPLNEPPQNISGDLNTIDQQQNINHQELNTQQEQGGSNQAEQDQQQAENSQHTESVQEKPLTMDQKIEVKETYMNLINKIYDNSYSGQYLWSKIGGGEVVDFMKDTTENQDWKSEYPSSVLSLFKEDALAEMHNDLSSHLQDLKEVSGLEPQPATELTSGESIENYVTRALEKIERLGKMDEIKIKLEL
jgi:hypothetical protein